MVELLLTLLVLYGLQCAVLLPRGGVLFARILGSWQRSEGPGWRLLHPWPSARVWLGSRSAWLEDAEGLRLRGATPWLGAGFAEGGEPRFAPGAGQPVEVRGSRVLVAGRPVLRGLGRPHAAALGALLAELARPGADAEAVLDRAVRESFDLDALREADARIDEATRWLAVLADVCFLMLFAALPALAWWLGGERALVLLAGPYLLLHVAALVGFGLAHRRLLPDAGGARFEALFTAALYPPLLLRAAQDLRGQLLAAFHPAAVAAVALPEQEALAFLRTEIARCTADGEIANRERAGLLATLEALGGSLEALLAPPAPADPLARSYCPRCRTEYRILAGACSDCGSDLEPLQGTS